VGVTARCLWVSETKQGPYHPKEEEGMIQTGIACDGRNKAMERGTKINDFLCLKDLKLRRNRSEVWQWISRYGQDH
jgi:hypothetical protein